MSPFGRWHMKSRYRVSLYFNPLLNDEGASMVDRSPIVYDNSLMFYNNNDNRLTCNIIEYETLSCRFEAAEFIFDCKNSQIPLIEYKRSCIPPIKKLGSEKEIMKRFILRHEI